MRLRWGIEVSFIAGKIGFGSLSAREQGKSAVRRLVTPLVKLIARRGENLVDGFEIELLADDVPRSAYS